MLLPSITTPKVTPCLDETLVNAASNVDILPNIVAGSVCFEYKVGAIGTDALLVDIESWP